MSATVTSAVKSVLAFFNRNSKEFNEDARLNELFLKTVQDRANALLEERGHVFLNDIYDLLGIERTPEGQRKGWLAGGHKIIFEYEMNRVGDFRLTFRPDGEIIDLI